MERSYTVPLYAVNPHGRETVGVDVVRDYFPLSTISAVSAVITFDAGMIAA